MKKYLYTLVSTVLFVFALSGQQAFAALSASVSLVSSVGQINQPMFGNVAIVNTGAAVNILAFRPTASATGNSVYSPVPAAFSVFNGGPNSPNLVVAANATTTVPFQVVFFSPSNGILSNNGGTYSVGALISTSDGSVFAPAAAALATVNALPYPATQQ